MTLINNKPANFIENSYRKKLKLENKIVFVYGGNIGVAQDIDNILRLAQRCSVFTDSYFLIVGSGSEESRISMAISKQGLNNISILPPLQQSEYFSMLSEFDVGLISLSKKLTTHNFPGKMLGYMHARLPIVASINPGNDLHDVISNAKAGLVCENGHDDKFYGLVKQLAHNAVLRKQMGDNARKLLIEKFSVKKAAQIICSSLINI
jgi:glycosyltransferase involved in cell wall biosynthesis